jgi:hypothetical protein
LGVTKNHAACFVAENQTQRNRVERTAKPNRLCTRLRHCGRGGAGYFFQVTEGSFDLSVVVARFDTEPCTECREPLSDGSVSTTAVDEDAEKKTEEQDAKRSEVDRDVGPFGDHVGG